MPKVLSNAEIGKVGSSTITRRACRKILPRQGRRPLLNPQKLYKFLSHLSEVGQGEPELRNDVHRAMKHFVLPLTSEFYGVSMVALNKMLASNQMAFSDEDKKLAAIFVKQIQENWFKPGR
jgi:hypothetical protein